MFIKLCFDHDMLNLFLVRLGCGWNLYSLYKIGICTYTGTRIMLSMFLFLFNTSLDFSNID